MSRFFALSFIAALLSACGGAPTDVAGETEPAGTVQSAWCSGEGPGRARDPSS